MVKQKKIPDGYKMSEVGIIPCDWTVINLGDNSKIKARIGWQGLTTKEYLKSGDYYLITGTDFINGRIEWDSCYFVEEKRYLQDYNIQIKKGDVLITKDGTIGKVAYVDKVKKPATLNSGIFVIKPNTRNYLSEFLYYIFQSFYFEKFLNQLTAGSTINHLYQKDIVKFTFILPEEKEQKAIATALSDMDDLILSMKKLIDKKKLIKQGTMQELLSGKKRLDGFEGEWKNKKISDILYVFNGGTPNTLNSNYWNGNIKWCTPTDITKCTSKYLYDTQKKITIEGLKASSARLLPKGSILLCSRATIGEARIAGNEITTNQGFKSLICKEYIDNEFIYYYITILKNVLIEKAIGSTFLEISKKDINEIIIYLPEYKEQKAIAKILSDMDQEIEKLEIKLDKYKQIKKGMMEELLTGKRRLI